MILPRDEVLYADLRTSFTDIDALMADLRERCFSGYVALRDNAVEATVLFDQGCAGRLRLAVAGRQIGVAEARAEITSIARRGSGSIDVYKLEPALVELIAALERRDTVHRDLSTAFTSPEGLLAKLHQDGLSGCVEINIAGGSGEAAIYLREGPAIAAVFIHEERTWLGPEAVSQALLAAAAQGAMFSVYRPAAWTAPVNGPLASAPVEGAPGGEAHLQVVAGQDVLAFWSEMLSRAEAVVDSLGQPGKFAVAFREVRVERAECYPFLDPFAADFEYRDGVVSFAGPPPPELSEALGECLQDALARLAFRLKRADVETRVHAELVGLGGRVAHVVESFPLSVQALVS